MGVLSGLFSSFLLDLEGKREKASWWVFCQVSSLHSFLISCGKVVAHGWVLDLVLYLGWDGTFLDLWVVRYWRDGVKVAFAAYSMIKQVDFIPEDFHFPRNDDKVTTWVAILVCSVIE